MPPLPGARPGDVLEAKGRPLPFSYFPVTKGNRRYGLYDTVFAVSPWSLMRGEVSKRLRDAEEAEALAFLQQAEDLCRAASRRLYQPGPHLLRVCQPRQGSDPLSWVSRFLRPCDARHVRVEGFGGQPATRVRG